MNDPGESIHSLDEGIVVSQNVADVLQPAAESKNKQQQFRGKGTPENPYVVDWDLGDPENPYNWPNPRKWLITLQVRFVSHF